MFCLHFLRTHKSYHPENPTNIGRHRKVQLDIFSFITHLLFIKWETCEIDVQELFWASIEIKHFDRYCRQFLCLSSHTPVHSIIIIMCFHM